MTDDHNIGVEAAGNDIKAGRLRLFSGAPSRTTWAADLANTLRERFGIEVVFVSCLTNAEKREYETAYNGAVQAHIDEVFGQGALAGAMEEVQMRRKARYDEYFA